MCLLMTHGHAIIDIIKVYYEHFNCWFKINVLRLKSKSSSKYYLQHERTLLYNI